MDDRRRTTTTTTTGTLNSTCPRLYGRSNEMKLLRQWYNDTIVDTDNNTSSNRTLLGVVSGPIGVGKRTLIESTLQPHVKQSHGLFLSGQFHSAHHDKSTGKTLSSRPFGAICEALNRLVCSMDNEDDDDYDNDTKATLREALSVQFRSEGDREILSELVQEVTQWLIVDDPNIPKRRYSSASQSISSIPPPFVKTSSVNAPQVQRDILVHLIQVIASHIPLVLYMEHIESADHASIDLFEALRTNADYPMGTGLLLILSVDDECMLPDSILKYTQQQNDSLGGNEDVVSGGNIVSYRTLRLMPLSREHTFTWAFEQFGRNDTHESELHEVTDMIYENSDCGIAQYIRFHMSYFSILVNIDPEWNDATIDIFRSTMANCSPNEIYVKILQSVCPETLTVVELVAALVESGRQSVDASVLDIVLQRPCIEMLDATTEIGLLESVDQKYCFPVLDLQSVVYAFIPESKRASLHLLIGRKLWSHIKMDIQDPMTDENADMLDIVSRNLDLGLGLVTDKLELDIIVSLNLRAGKHAAISSSFAAAAEYFESAISALGDRAWSNDCYNVSLVLYNCVSEAHYGTANFERMTNALEVILRNARTFNDKLLAYTTVVYANGARDRLNEAINTAFDVLHQLGETVPSNAGILTVLLQYFKTKRKVGRRSIRYFLNLPAAANEDKIAAMQMLNFAMMYAYVTKPYCGILAAFRLLQLALEYGMTAPAIPAFGAFGYFNCFLMGNRELGVHFGQISLALLEETNAKKYYLPRIYFIAHGVLNRWAYPVRESLEPMRLANRSAFKTGDMEGYALTAYQILELSFLAGKPLAPLVHEGRLACQEAGKFDQVLGLIYLVPLWSVLHDLMGISTVPLGLQHDTITDAASALDRAVKDGNKMALSLWYYEQTMFCCLNAKHYDAVAMAKKSRCALPAANLWMTFFEGISALAIARNEKGRKHWYYLSIGRRSYKYVKKCAKTCPSNFPNKRALLGAELATMEGNTNKAFTLFNESIKKAYQEGFVHEAGLAYERLGHYNIYLGNSSAAVPCFESARDAYSQWGAQSLVHRLEHVLTHLDEMGE